MVDSILVVLNLYLRLNEHLDNRKSNNALQEKI